MIFLREFLEKRCGLHMDFYGTMKSTLTWLKVGTSRGENKNFDTNFLVYKAKQLAEKKQMALHTFSGSSIYTNSMIYT